MPPALGRPPPPPQQLPAQMFTTAAQLLDLTDNIDRGLFLVRGENVLLLGEIDLDKDDDAPPGYDLADAELVQNLAKQRKQQDKTKEKKKVRMLAKEGFEGENLGEVLL
ncbi:hypothetical protein NEMBOFW57_009740 [Staphylotrichum longicolle]|uniref:LSM domain-containing protein n=1 Tax=Staphylotrichum longicolle TaxID=669026 RepID=A0AAD4EPM9_9PEZI|nr:hypothetical protein NEMBOFW57_009740 [Staphylotrichum longicolle]